MMKILGLFYFLLMSVQSLDAATLTLRGHAPAVFHVEWINAQAKVISNIPSSLHRLKPTIIETQNNRERIITIVHP